MEHKTKMAKQRIVVMYGGKADEHSISCISAAGVLRALDTDKFEAIEVGITKNGEWIVGGEDPRKWNMSEGLPMVEDGFLQRCGVGCGTRPGWFLRS